MQADERFLGLLLKATVQSLKQLQPQCRAARPNIDVLRPINRLFTCLCRHIMDVVRLEEQGQARDAVKAAKARELGEAGGCHMRV